MTPHNELLKKKILDERNELKNCPFCSSHIADRKVVFYKELIAALYEVYCWLGKNQQHEFHMNEVKHLFSKNSYARFGDFVRCGGIIYRPKNSKGKSRKARYGMNMTRAREFFHGERDIPIQITLNQITGEIVSEIRGKIGDFPDLKTMLDKNGLHDSNAEHPKLFPSTSYPQD